jgi:hypothetical protein
MGLMELKPAWKQSKRTLSAIILQLINGSTQIIRELIRATGSNCTTSQDGLGETIRAMNGIFGPEFWMNS